MTEENQGLDIPELVSVIDGTVNDLKNYVSENDLTDNEIQQILETEKASKQRKTVIQFLEKTLENREVSSTLQLAKHEIDQIEGIVRELEDYQQFQEAAETEEIDTDTLLQLIGGTVDELRSYVKEHQLGKSELQELLDAEKTVKDRKTAKDIIQKELDRLNVEKDIEKAEEDIEQLREDIETIEAKTDPETEPVIEENEDEDIDEIAEALEEVSNEIEENEEEDEEDVIEEIAEEDEEPEKEEEEDNKLEEKKELVKDLDIEMTDEELKEIDIDHLKELREEKAHREELVEFLEDHGFDEEELKSATTKDLEKIKNSIDEPEEDSPEEETQEEEEEKDEEEIKEEAKEDLEMLMGAVKARDSKEEEEEDRFEDLKQFKSKLTNVFSRDSDDEEEEDKGMTPENILDLLESYEELGDKEAAIKTAHIMKGYLEYTQDISREMTYKELADTLEGIDGESLERVLEFFRKMHIDQYTGDMEDINVDEAITAAKETVEELG